MAFNDYWDKVYCINLDRRQDRWHRVTQEFEKHGIEVERFSAIETPDPKQACTLSHVFAVKKAKAEGAKRLFIFEDDVELHPVFQELFEAFMDYVPDWDMVFLGCNPKSEMHYIYKNIYSCDRFWCTHAYGIRGKAFEWIGAPRVSLEKAPPDIVFNRFVYPDMRVYISYPHLAWQIDDYSDIERAFVENSRWTR